MTQNSLSGIRNLPIFWLQIPTVRILNPHAKLQFSQINTTENTMNCAQVKFLPILQNRNYKINTFKCKAPDKYHCMYWAMIFQFHIFPTKLINTMYTHITD